MDNIILKLSSFIVYRSAKVIYEFLEEITE